MDSDYALPVARWTPDAKARLQQAATELFMERGYDAVTVADIAARAGLTKRSFFNHFADKAEVLFDGSDAFGAQILAALEAADPAIDPLSAAVSAYASAAVGFADHPEQVRARGELIAASPDLQERELKKMASLTATAAEVLERRGVPPREAHFIAQAATTIFTAAAADWSADPARSFDDVMAETSGRYRAAFSLTE